jgi:poly(hydroxyalkanoate) granule-associated protein
MKPIQTIKDTPRAAQDLAETLGGYAKTTFFAGLGVLALLQEEADKVFQQLVSEGRAVEAGRSRTLTAKAYTEAKEEVAEAEAEIEEAVARTEAGAEAVSQKAQAQTKALEERVAEAVTTALQRLNVPTREDVDALKRSIERLDKKSAELRAA